MTGPQSIVLATLASVIILSLAGVLAVVYLADRGETGYSLMPILIGFLAPTIVALLALLRANDSARDAKEVKRLVEKSGIGNGVDPRSAGLTSWRHDSEEIGQG